MKIYLLLATAIVGCVMASEPDQNTTVVGHMRGSSQQERRLCLHQGCVPVFSPYCCPGYSCQAFEHRCYNYPRRLGQPCAFDACDSGLSCQPGILKCYHFPRREGEPCVAGHPCGPDLSCEAGSQTCRAHSNVGEGCHATRPCRSGLSCQPGVLKCYHYPRREGEPCVLGHPCAHGLTCEAGSQVCRAPGNVGDSCHATRPCRNGLSCQPGVQKCYHFPRREGEPCVAGHPCTHGLTCEAGSQVCRAPGNEGDPCHATRPCRSGLSCEAGSQVCRAPGNVGDSCHLTRPCGNGLSCQPGVQKCYHLPRREGEPCVLGHPCTNGLTCVAGSQVCRAPGNEGDPCHLTQPCRSGLSCEAGSQVCRAPGNVGDSCHLTRPCGDGLSCQPGVHKCYHLPRREGEPCVLGHPCTDGLACEAGSQVCRAPGDVGDPCHLTRPCRSGLSCEAGSHICQAPGAFEDACHLTRPCGDGLSCQPGVHKCYHVPRRVYEPCSLGFDCGEGLECALAIHICVPRQVNPDSSESCDALKVQDLSNAAVSQGRTMSYGAGITISAGFALDAEVGTVYGENGEFGCYTTFCPGVEFDISVGIYANVGIWNNWQVFEGESQVVFAGGSSPKVELTFTTGLAYSTASSGVIGSITTLSFGLGINPISVGHMRCITTVLRNHEPVAVMQRRVEAYYAENVDTPTPNQAPSLPSPSPSPNAPSSDGLPTKGGMMGDPHILKWDGEWFDFMGGCDLVLVDAPSFGNGLGLTIHVRTTPRYDTSFIESAAIMIGEDVLEVSSYGQYHVNGVWSAKMPCTLTGFSVSYLQRNANDHLFEIKLSSQFLIRVSVHKDLVSVKFALGSAQVGDENFADSVGIMGSWKHGTRLDRNGTAVLNDDNEFGQEWQVRETEPMLFSFVRDPQYPAPCKMPQQTLTNRRLGEGDVSRKAAEAACSHLKNGLGYEQCVYDAMATNDLTLASAEAAFLMS